MLLRLSAVTAVFFLGLTPVLAGETHAGNLAIYDAWARATIGMGKTGAAYLTIVNHGSAADRLVAAETPQARRAALHTHLQEGGVMKMRHVDGVDIAGGKSRVFAPGGHHVMLMGLKSPLVEGGAFPLDLTFAHAGTVRVQVAVAGATATQAANPHPHAAHHAEGSSHKHRDDDQHHKQGGHHTHGGHPKHGGHHAHGKLLDLSPGTPVPTVELSVAPDDVGGWNLHIETTNFRFAPHHVNGANVDGEGHAHLYVNGKKIARVYGPWFHIPTLPKGMVKLRVTLNANDHRDLAAGGKALAKTVDVHVH